MKFIELIETYQDGMDGEEMLAIAKAVGNHVSETMKGEEEDRLCNAVYGIIGEGHFDKPFAERAIRKMWYEDENGEKHPAPYYTDEEVKAVFASCKDDISDYTLWDLAVTMNKLHSDYFHFLNRHYADKEKIKGMVAEMAICYLQDPDGADVGRKIWSDINR